MAKAKKTTGADLVREIRSHKHTAAWYCADFLPLSTADRHKIIELLRHDFDIWWNAWIDPLLDELETKLDKKKRVMDAMAGVKHDWPHRDVWDIR